MDPLTLSDWITNITLARALIDSDVSLSVRASTIDGAANGLLALLLNMSSTPENPNVTYTYSDSDCSIRPVTIRGLFKKHGTFTL